MKTTKQARFNKVILIQFFPNVFFLIVSFVYFSPCRLGNMKPIQPVKLNDNPVLYDLDPC